MIQAIIFDFDGVILDSADLKTEAFRRMFSVYPSQQEEIVDYHRRNMGISRYVKFRHIYENILKKKYTVEDESGLGAEFEKQVFQAVMAANFIPGADDFLKKNFEKYLCFIASGTPEAELKLVVKERGLEHFFKAVHGSPRNKSEIIREILTLYRLSPEHVLFVGDAETDRRAAEETGLHFLGRGTDANQFLKSVKLIQSLENLTDEINQLNGYQKK